jgi:hypothetical protein
VFRRSTASHLFVSLRFLPHLAPFVSPDSLAKNARASPLGGPLITLASVGPFLFENKPASFSGGIRSQKNARASPLGGPLKLVGRTDLLRKSSVFVSIRSFEQARSRL